MSKIIISCAITGSVHTPSMSPYLPFRPEHIAEEAVLAAEAGAAILHLHARDPQNGRPSSEPGHFLGFLPRIASQTGAIINISTGASATMTMEQRLRAAREIEPEMCSLNMGSMNFALYPIAERIDTWRYDWEQPFLRDSDDLVFKNTPRDIACILETMGDCGARFEFECYDLSHLYMLDHFAGRGMLEYPLFIQFVFGVLGGTAASPEHLVAMKQTADKLFGDDYLWSVLAAGRQQIPFASISAAMNGHVRVGLEDNLYIGKGKLAKSNAEQVSRIRRIAEAMDREIAGPDEARELLGLKGPRKTRIPA